MKDNPTNVLYISYDGMTDPLGQSQVLPYLVGLSKKDIRFTLLSCEKKEHFSQNKTLVEAICKENNIDWQPIFYTKPPPVLSTIWDIFKLKKSAQKLHREKQFDVVHCRSYISSLIGLKMKQKYSIKFIFDMRGFWADERVDGGLWNTEKFIYKSIYNYFKKKEKAFLQQADRVVSLTNAGKNEMLQWEISGLKAEKITVIPCVADYDVFELKTPEKAKMAKQNLGLSENQFVLLYLGSIGTWYLLDEMLQFFSELKKQKPDAKFLFITGQKKDEIYKAAEKYDLEKEDFIIQFSQRKEIPKLAHAADYGIFFIKPLFSKISSSPTKMGEMLAMGIPIICNSGVGDVQEIVEQTKAGFCLDDLTVESLQATALKIIAANSLQANEIREKSRAYFDLQNAIDLYHSVYNVKH